MESVKKNTNEFNNFIIFVAGVHCSGKRGLLERACSHSDLTLLPRLPRSQLFCDRLLRGVLSGSKTARKVLHGNLHDRFSQSISEWEWLLSFSKSKQILVSDRSMLDAICYLGALNEAGWIDTRNCAICLRSQSILKKFFANSNGIFIDFSPRSLLAEAARRRNSTNKPTEHASGHLLRSNVHFKKNYISSCRKSSNWNYISCSYQNELAPILNRTLMRKAAELIEGG